MPYYVCLGFNDAIWKVLGLCFFVVYNRPQAENTFKGTCPS